jgi:hypothetical protein
VELVYGGLDIPHHESTDITSYSYEGSVMGERIRLNRPRELFFDEVSVTYGYLGDLNSSGVNKRFWQLTQSNFHRFILAKQIGERARASADYTFESGVETTREAIRVCLPELWLTDMLHLGNSETDRLRTCCLWREASVSQGQDRRWVFADRSPHAELRALWRRGASFSRQPLDRERRPYRYGFFHPRRGQQSSIISAKPI